jgi:phosphatidylethanolamine-binding protein (PEBP) family uncharacterized protein
MTLAEMKAHVMFQTNNDAEDVGDYLPSLLNYLNDGYDRLVKVWTKSHMEQEEYPWLAEDTDVPNLPEWLHVYICDWATWLVYRNGNPQKQQRGYAFRANFLEMLAKVAEEGGAAGLNEDGTQKTYRNFINIPV